MRTLPLDVRRTWSCEKNSRTSPAAGSAGNTDALTPSISDGVDVFGKSGD